MEWKRIGYGTWPLAGDVSGSISYGKTNDEVSKQALKKAFECGINVYDTSDLYWFGHVEKLIGEVFESNRRDIVIVTKGGMINLNDDQDFSVDHLVSALFNSLYRLRTNYVDVYMLHNATSDVLECKELQKFIKKHLNSGTIKQWGISLKTPSDGFDFIKYKPQVIEVNYNILDRRAEFSGLINLYAQNNIKIIARTPLSQGILSGKFEITDDKSDRRNRLDKTYIEKSTRVYKKMMSSLIPNNYSDAQNCLRFCLYDPSISVIIPGMKTANQVVENVLAQHIPTLTKDEVGNITKIYKEENL